MSRKNSLITTRAKTWWREVTSIYPIPEIRGGRKPCMNVDDLEQPAESLRTGFGRKGCKVSPENTQDQGNRGDIHPSLDLDAISEGDLSSAFRKYTIRFKNSSMEEDYYRKQLLPNRILHLRLLAFLQLLQYSVCYSLIYFLLTCTIT